MAIVKPLGLAGQDQDDTEQMTEVSLDGAQANPLSGISVTPTDDGGVVVDFGGPSDSPATSDGATVHGANLADGLDEAGLTKIASELVSQYMSDRVSRADWEKQYLQGLELLGMKIEERSKPWNGACGVFHPLLAESVVRFQAQTIQEVYPAQGPVKTKVVGKGTKEKLKQAIRVQNYLNYMITEEMVEYREEMERLLFSLPIAGSAFKKVYFDQNLDRACATFVPAEDFIVSYGTTSLLTCPRATHFMRIPGNEMEKLMKSGFYRQVDLTRAQPNISEIEKKYQELTGNKSNSQHDDRYEAIEMMVDLNFEDESDVARPYVVTIDLGSRKILSIYRNWYESDSLRRRRSHFVHYQYLPGLGFYGFGLVHMIGGLAKSSTSLLRMLVDAGTLSNLPGGLKARGMNIKGDDTPIAPGEFRDVDVPGGTIKENIAFLPYKEPSTVLYTLLKDLVDDGRRFASAADVKAADINGEAPVGTTLAVLEREMKVISAVQARIHASMKQELRLLVGIVRDYGPKKYPYEEEGEETTEKDFDDRVDIVPVSDPNAGTMAQRIMQYQAALQLSAQAPQMYDLPTLHRQMLEALGLHDVESIIPLDEEMKPVDPITENMEIIKGGQVRAFAYQDHEAHIQAHLAAAQNPKLLELLSMAPDAQVKQAAMSAHISEHLAFAYRERVEKELGVSLPDPSETLPEDVEYRLSKLVAPAAAQLTGKDAREAEAKKQLEQAQDPIFQLQKRELDLKEKELDLRDKEVDKRISADLKKHEDRIDLEHEKLESKEEIEGTKLGVKIGVEQANLAIKNRQISSNEQIRGTEIGTQIARDNLFAKLKGKVTNKKD